MRPVEKRIATFLLSRPATFLMMMVGVLAAVVAFNEVSGHPYLADSGFLFPSPNQWPSDSTTAFIAGLSLTVIIASMMEAINRTFNLLRSSTILFLGIFFIMQCATPMTIDNVTSGLILNVTVLGVLATFYTCYMRPRQTRRIFLVFFVMSALSLADYIYLIFIGLFLLGFSQMRCNCARMWLAALMGIAAPWWMAWGFGLGGDDGFHWPDGQSIFTSLDKRQLMLMVITMGFTIIFQFLLCVSNILKVYSYNARSRALSGLLLMLSLATALAALINIGNAPAYLSLLNCFTAFQATLFIMIREQRRGYILIVATIIIFATLFALQLWMS